MYEGEDIAGKFGQSDYEYEIGFALSPQFFFRNSTCFWGQNAWIINLKKPN